MQNQMGSESSGEEIESNISKNIKKENLLLAHYSGFPRRGNFLNEDPPPIET